MLKKNEMEHFHINSVLNENDIYKCKDWALYRKYLIQLIDLTFESPTILDDVQYIKKISNRHENSIVFLCFLEKVGLCVVKDHIYDEMNNGIPYHVAKEVSTMIKLRQLRFPYASLCIGIKMNKFHTRIFTKYFPMTLTKVISEGILEYRKFVLNIVKSLLIAVSTLHKNGITHRDIKMENMCLDEKGRIVLIDFDSSGPLGFGYNVNLGSICTRAPEINHFTQGTVERYDNELIDAWSTGVTIIAIATGRYDITQKNINEHTKQCENLHSTIREEKSKISNILIQRLGFKTWKDCIIPLVDKHTSTRKRVIEIKEYLI